MKHQKEKVGKKSHLLKQQEKYKFKVMNNKKKIDFGIYFTHSFLFVKSICQWLCEVIEPMDHKKSYKSWIIFSRDLPPSISINTLIPKAIIQRIRDISMWQNMVSTFNATWLYECAPSAENSVEIIHWKWASDWGRTRESTRSALHPHNQFPDYTTSLCLEPCFCSCTSPLNPRRRLIFGFFKNTCKKQRNGNIYL